jgi:hypothetical protein
LRPASEQAQTAAELASAFQLNLGALSLLALVVGMFLIYNMVLFAVVQRRRVLGILRALGVTREQVLALILLEAAAVSLLGSLLGPGLGWLLAQVAVRLISQTINDLYFVVTVRQTGLSLFSALKGGIRVTAGTAALGPAYEAASVPSITAMQASTLEDRLRRYVPALTAAGVLLLALGRAVPHRDPLAGRRIRRHPGDWGGHRPAFTCRHGGRDEVQRAAAGRADGQPGAEGSAHRGEHAQPHPRRDRRVDGRALGDHRGKPDDIQLPRDRRQLAGSHARGRRPHSTPAWR